MNSPPKISPGWIGFALFHLLGLQFAQRIRDLGAQRLYRLDAPPQKEGVAVLLKGLVRSKTLLDNWDELLRVAGSLKLGWVTASLLISKLQTGATQNVLSRALRDLGRLVKTQFILRWIENPDYRRRIHRQLDPGVFPFNASKYLGERRLKEKSLSKGGSYLRDHGGTPFLDRSHCKLVRDDDFGFGDPQLAAARAMNVVVIVNAMPDLDRLRYLEQVGGRWG